MTTFRTYPRTLREAFREHAENCFGIERMPVIHTAVPWPVRVLRWLLRR